MEPLIPLQNVVASEIRRLDIRCSGVRIDLERGAVIVDEVTSPWGPRVALAAALRRARLDVEVQGMDPAYRFCVYASDTAAQN